jgi:hypothetical protein
MKKYKSQIVVDPYSAQLSYMLPYWMYDIPKIGKVATEGK